MLQDIGTLPTAGAAVGAGEMNKDLTSRTPGEELWLWRRRQVSPSGRSRSRVGSGLSQAEAAQMLGMATQRYHDAEAGSLPERDIRTILADLNNGDHHEPTIAELCALARRRAKWTLRQAQDALGFSRVTFLERERVGDSSVVRLWRNAGFRFD